LIYPGVDSFPSMVEGVTKLVETDMAGIPVGSVTAPTERDRVLKILAHAYLRLWTRLALESGQKLKLAPSQYVLGTYEGQMNWNLNEAVDYRGLAQLQMGATFRKTHMLVSETYILKGEERVRVFFALEDERVKGKPVFVDYLVYDAPVGEFDLAKVIDALKPLLPNWLETITTADDGPLWKACEEKLECVGI
jgi:hypothetical protein